MHLSEKLILSLPDRVRAPIERYIEALEVLASIGDPRVLRALGPAGVRGLILRRGRRHQFDSRARHTAHFDWRYERENAQLSALNRRARAMQWDADSLPWQTSVDPIDPEVPLLPASFFDFDELGRHGIRLDASERRELLHRIAAWLLSQFLHGEQGALYAAAQVTEAIQSFDAKLTAATQVMDEGRHVDVFQRYVSQKLGRLYPINDNLFVIIDALIGDRRWDMKFLGMQIMVEGLALGAFGTLYRLTREPLLRELLRLVIRDEARHVQFGVLALARHYKEGLDERERREREDWAFEVALLMRNRFLIHEVYEESFEGLISRRRWRAIIDASPGMQLFRGTMLRRLVPNLREIGLMSPRILPRYERAGMTEFYGGAAATALSEEQLIADLDG